MRFRVVAAVLLAVAIAGAGCSQSPGIVGAPSGARNIDPRTTDSAISSDLVYPHISQPAGGVVRNRLVILLHGSNANPQGLTELIGGLASDGYHVVAPRYSAQLSSLGGCPDESAVDEPDCHREFRSETVFGQNVVDPEGASYNHPLLNITKPNSVRNRLVKLVNYLAATYPSENWNQFLNRSAAGVCTETDPTYGSCALDWSKTVLIGHSQGAAVALYLARFYAADRVGLLSGTYDAYINADSSIDVAPWVLEGRFAVPASRITMFFHTGDPAVGRFRAVAAALALPGVETNVTTTNRPYLGSHRLITSTTPSCPFDSSQTHNGTAVDLCVPDGLYLGTWRYMAGGA